MSEQRAYTLHTEDCSNLDDWLKKFPAQHRRSAVLYGLRIVQEREGWLSTAMMNAVADYLGVEHAGVYEVATFYSMYRLKPEGRRVLSVCQSISCRLRGSDALLDHLRTCYGVGLSETSPDGCFSVKPVECLAACVGAPAVLVDDKHYHENITPEHLDRLIQSFYESETEHGQ